jgi:hypothetical protein
MMTQTKGRYIADWTGDMNIMCRERANAKKDDNQLIR